MTPEKINDNVSLFSQDGSLDFGTDAYLLSAYMRKNVKTPTAELGCGNGVISLLCASRGKTSHITAFEIQPSLSALAAKNVEFNGLGEKVSIVNADIKSLDAKYNGTFGAVIANPPYLKIGSGKSNDDASAAVCRREVCGGIADFARCASKLLHHGGCFSCVYRPDRIAELLYSLRQASLEPKRLTLVYPTTEHVPCLVLCEAKKGGADGVFVTKPLIIYSSPSDMTVDGYSADMKYIYENGDFDDCFKKPGKH